MTDETTVSPSGDEVAADARARAKAAGARGRADRGDLTRAQRALRDTAIIASLHAGEEVKAVAKEFGITRRAVELIRQRHERAPSILSEAPAEIFGRMISTYDDLIHVYTRVAEDTLERAPAVCVQAIRSAAEVHERRLVLMQTAGMLPQDLRLFRSQQEMDEAGGRLQELLARAVDEEWPVQALYDEFRAWQQAEVGVTIDVKPSDVHELPPGDG